MKCADHSRWHQRVFGLVAVSLVATIVMIAPQRAQAACTGDCSGDGEVTVNELITMVNIALGTAQVSACMAGDVNGDGEITVNEIVAGVNNALNGCPAAMGGCGDGVVEAGEDCDNGGTCIGGTNAGTHCTAESQCQGDGVCIDGTKRDTACSSNADCPNSKCVHCRTFGGAGCAANCTTESVVHVALVPGQSPDGTSITDGTSGLVVNSPTITIGIPFIPGTTRELTIGKQKDGKIPTVLKAATNTTAGIDVLNGAACICLRPIVLMTCGGTVREKTGLPSIDCTAGYTAGDSLCAGTKPCTFAFGDGNAGTGDVGCDALDGVNVTATQDSGGSSSPVDSCGGSGTPGPGPVLTTLSDAGGAGSAVISIASELGFTLAACTGTTADYGPDGKFCTTDDPKAGRMVQPQVLTTSTASATVFNADCTDGDNIGPFMTHGAPLSCSALASGSASGGVLVGAFPGLNAPTIQDIVVTDAQAAQ